jgi:hypothetical protein
MAAHGQDISATVAATAEVAFVLRQQASAARVWLGVSSAVAPEPFTPAERWRHYVHRTYSAPRLGLLAAETSLDQLMAEPACWDRGPASYARRYTRSLERRVLRNTAELGAGLLTGEDLRYTRSTSVRPSARFWNAFRGALFARMPDGTQRPAYTRIFAGAVADISTAHWVRQPLLPSWMAQSLAWSTLDQIQTNLLDEFGPDLRRTGRRLWNNVRTDIRLPNVPIRSAISNRLPKTQDRKGPVALGGRTQQDQK